MNFYAHLVAASWHTQNPEFAAGAMLPDFATMSGVRLPNSISGALGAGVDFHHQCDRIFHGLSSFRDQERWALRHMQASGLRRGPARGIAHVGVELCLDGALVGSPATDALYLKAIESLLDNVIRWKRPNDAESFAHLTERLMEFGVPIGYQDSDIVADRLIRILGPRPLLALNDIEKVLLPIAIAPLHRRVESEAENIMKSVALEIREIPTPQ